MARESSLEERERKDQEKAAYVKERQVRLGDIPDPEETETETTTKKSPSKPKANKSKKS